MGVLSKPFNMSTLIDDLIFRFVRGLVSKLGASIEKTLTIDDTNVDQSDREVSPKLIVGNKKYGRRSVPQSIINSDSSESDSEDEEHTERFSRRMQKTQSVIRSCSQSDIARRRGVNIGPSKLKRCASLPAQKNLRTRFQQQTVVEPSQKTSSAESLDTASTKKLETIPVNSVVEMWERVGIPEPKQLLIALGFDVEDDCEVNIKKLSRMLDDSIQSPEIDYTENVLLKAALALRRGQVSCLFHTVRHLEAENKKLYSDKSEANRRAALLAQEVDERHAHLESTAKEEIKCLEQRHAEAIKEIRAQFTNDREITRLESQIKSYQLELSKLKDEIVQLTADNTNLENEQVNFQKQITDLLETNIKLNTEIVDRETMPVSTGNETEEVLELFSKIGVLQTDNANLRDKNDELMSEIDTLTVDLQRFKMKASKATSTMEEIEDVLAGSAVKRRGDSPSKTQIPEESPRTGKLRRCNSETELEGECVALELQNPILSPKSKVVQLESRCKELETSLDQLSKAYEDCEDYWQDKLSQERKMFEKERQIYDEEQQDNDRKFTELMEKVREYEDQFSKDSRLSTIEEKDGLEQQYTDLEKEFEDYKEKSMIEFEDKSKEIEELRTEIDNLRMEINENKELFDDLAKSNTQHILNSNNSPASSPISYLMQQSTIQSPMKCRMEDPRQTRSLNLSTSETAYYSTTNEEPQQIPAPIQKPKSNSTTAPASSKDEDASSTSSIASQHSCFETHSVASTHSVHKSLPGGTSNSIGIKEELKRLKFFEVQLKEHIKDLTIKRDSLVMELQQLQEAKPVLEKAYARAAHPSLIQRVNQLELRNRHLQNVIKQQQHYTENLLQQTWQQYTVEKNEIHSRLEAQAILITEQAQRLANSDLLVKDLYVENSNLTAQIQMMEQQRSRANYLQMQQHQHHQGLTGLPGMP
ncbi:NINL family protein [Megaselia abdita]